MEAIEALELEIYPAASVLANLHTKFEVSSSNLSGDMEGQKISKVGYVTHFKPPLT